MLFAQSPFNGTWKTLYESKFSPKPITFYVKDGIYDSSSPQIHVKADGQDQSVRGLSYDTIAVKEIDARTIRLVTKKNGKTISEQTRTVSEDGKTLISKVTSHPPDSDQTTTTETTWERVGGAIIGANTTSGSWGLQKLRTVLSTFKGSADELTYSDSTGESWTAKLDGKDYPVKGTAVDSVSLKKIDDRTIEASYKRGGKLFEVSKMTISPDGKRMTTVTDTKPTGRVSTYFADKQ
jgi:hypothetical protein